MSKIVQLMPALNWSAAFRDEETHIKGDTRPLVSWALCDDGSVVGTVVEGSEIRLVTQTHEQFLSYHYSGSTSAMSK